MTEKTKGFFSGIFITTIIFLGIGASQDVTVNELKKLELEKEIKLLLGAKTLEKIEFCKSSGLNFKEFNEQVTCIDPDVELTETTSSKLFNLCTQSGGSPYIGTWGGVECSRN